VTCSTCHFWESDSWLDGDRPGFHRCHFPDKRSTERDFYIASDDGHDLYTGPTFTCSGYERACEACSGSGWRNSTEGPGGAPCRACGETGVAK